MKYDMWLFLLRSNILLTYTRRGALTCKDAGRRNKPAVAQFALMEENVTSKHRFKRLKGTVQGDLRGVKSGINQ
jgi:hypothetical protein